MPVPVHRRRIHCLHHGHRPKSRAGSDAEDTIVQEIRIGEVCQVNLLGNVQITTQTIQTLCEAGIPIAYFSMGGWFYGITTGLNTKNIGLRRRQFRLADSEWFSLSLARTLTAGKIRGEMLSCCWM